MKKKLYRSLLVGVKVLVLAVGLFSLLYIFGVEIFSATTFTMEALLMIAGALLFYERYDELGSFRKRLKDVYLFMGLLLFLFGFFPLLCDSGVLNFMPVSMQMSVSPLLLSSLLFMYGLYAMVASVKK